MVLYLIYKGELKKQAMKLASIAILSLALFSCGTTNEVIKESESKESVEETEEVDDVIRDQAKPQKNYSMKSSIGEFVESDPMTIDSMKLEGNILFVTVTYSGGCSDHDFEFIGSPMIMKSMPPKRSVQLAHHANGDACRALLTRVLEIDLTNIAYKPESGSEIILLVKGSDKTINYIYE